MKNIPKNTIWVISVTVTYKKKTNNIPISKYKKW